MCDAVIVPGYKPYITLETVTQSKLRQGQITIYVMSTRSRGGWRDRIVRRLCVCVCVCVCGVG